jgi:glycosyltransferase involved in cell wall biosynthesis
MSTVHDSVSQFSELNYCVLLPTYNNAGTIKDVINRILKITDRLIVINDGCTDNTAEILSEFDELHVITHPQNQGKGKALQNGFDEAIKLGYSNAVTIDSDGQHFPEDIPLILSAAAENKGSLIVGARQLENAGQPGKNSFANRFSNFWFTVETGLKLPDTQSGFRLYPLDAICKIKLNSIHYDYELEILVKAAWKEIDITPASVRVYYPPGDERVSHFDPVKDFARISLLNVRLVIMALFWYRPLLAIKHFSIKRIRKMIHTSFSNPAESAVHKSNSVAIGIFFGIVPIWGYQLITAVFVAYLLKLNKAIVVLTAQISIPPMIPLILFLSIKTGELITGTKAVFSFSDLTVMFVKEQISVYLIGATVLAVVCALISWVITYFIYNKKQVTPEA